jgi:glycosyltransferase involved in cell wall biosynthesis
MKVSVIIPVYNLDKYIGRCLDSLLNQDFSDYEIIVVNDGSTDNTETVCKEYENKYPIIKLINKKNGGVSSARNEGINASSGDYLMFVDGDDYVTENYISTMYKFQIENPDQLIVCDMFKKTESSTEFNKSLRNAAITKPSLYPKEDFYLLYKFGLSGFPVNKIYSKEKIISSNIYFDTSLALGEDALFVIQYYKTCKGFMILPDPLYYYCILNSGAAMKYRKDRFNQICPSFSVRLPLIKEEHLPEYCDAFLYDFISCLKNTFDKRNTDSFFKKIKYNNSILKSKEFIFCLDHASKKNESPKYINLLKTKNYLIIYLFEKLLHRK